MFTGGTIWILTHGQFAPGATAYRDLGVQRASPKCAEAATLEPGPKSDALLPMCAAYIRLAMNGLERPTASSNGF